MSGSAGLPFPQEVNGVNQQRVPLFRALIANIQTRTFSDDFITNPPRIPALTEPPLAKPRGWRVFLVLDPLELVRVQNVIRQQHGLILQEFLEEALGRNQGISSEKEEVKPEERTVPGGLGYHTAVKRECDTIATPSIPFKRPLHFHAPLTSQDFFTNLSGVADCKTDITSKIPSCVKTANPEPFSHIPQSWCCSVKWCLHPVRDTEDLLAHIAAEHPKLPYIKRQPVTVPSQDSALPSTDALTHAQISQPRRSAVTACGRQVRDANDFFAYIVAVHPSLQWYLQHLDTASVLFQSSAIRPAPAPHQNPAPAVQSRLSHGNPSRCRQAPVSTSTLLWLCPVAGCASPPGTVEDICLHAAMNHESIPQTQRVPVPLDPHTSVPMLPVAKHTRKKRKVDTDVPVTVFTSAMPACLASTQASLSFSVIAVSPPSPSLTATPQSQPWSSSPCAVPAFTPATSYQGTPPKPTEQQLPETDMVDMDGIYC
ncbi:hypothetical protein SAICODRAFT_30065 [Saitoella complicata NRRL Y-17804]|uniref:Uncharacterized protein n=1 Tax=Saitoella complicata (strain BCRC 22490 / CBS 7301 / JCM 7358 / NBRC 10748 / NRRL Y-17804) TaxID=698492 RepID=A0A0E9NRF3_SAICN|nr:uncharacterized protein SAICODRAFT_30065 [Saitoella complicata NRRL Y-17804]ODQ53774.1 hypothetical protein SAICODRAFT_30065 [Saitoella complicata NRRL Y-17804]GAO52434.1 hypothetical protein G7K_6510-t2 [Saitoella complicata NRRL Y-17804]